MLDILAFHKLLVIGSSLCIVACGNFASDTEIAGSVGKAQWVSVPTSSSPVDAQHELGQPARFGLIADANSSVFDEGELLHVKKNIIFVQSTSHRITLNVSDYSTEALLDEISAQSGVSISWEHPLANKRTTLQLADVPLEHGLRRILNQQDIFFSFTPATEASSTADESALLLSGVWVFSRGEGSQIIPVSARQLASSSELTDELTHSDPKVRAHAVELLIARKGGGAIDDVRFALNDQDATVRERTLQAALSLGVSLPVAWLTALVQSDSSATVRSLSLAAITSGPAEVIASDPTIESIAKIALNDSNENVQAQAREVLDELEQLRQLEFFPQQSNASWPY